MSTNQTNNKARAAYAGYNAGKHKKKMSGADLRYNIIAGIIFSIAAFICIYPLYYLLICTISNNQMVEVGAITWRPVGIHFDNYKEVLEVENLGSSVIVTVLRTVIGTVLSVVVTAYTAYFFTKQEMWGRKFWYRFCVATMYFSAGLIPVYLNNKLLHLTNTFYIYIIPGIISVYNMVLIKTSIESMPAELEESAYLDGAGYFTRLFRIVFPLQKPILATVALFTAVGHWNDFFTTKLYIVNPKLYTMQFVLYEMLNQVQAQAAQFTSDNALSASSVSPTSIRMTMTAVTIIPIMVVYPFAQKYFTQGLMLGAVKG
ncbi:MAG: carbohydrate ABC transporter permease [Lachnospiraceae bacterium]|jgi:putative aldouronate transport system permease protein